MCGFEMCIIAKDLHDRLKAKCNKLLVREKLVLSEMADGHKKDACAARVNEYESEMQIDGLPNYTRTWDAADTVGCNPILVGEVCLPKFKCVLGRCPDCP